MQDERLGSGLLRFKDSRREEMLEPAEVSAILRLKELGWGANRIARELGISRNTARAYIVAGGWTAYRQPRRKKALGGLEDWLRERLRQHRGNADVVRQELAAEKGIVVSLRTVERAVKADRQELAAEGRATVRFETVPGKQLQIDIVMPGQNGKQLADEALKLRPSLKIIYMTGYSRNAVVHQGRIDPGVDLIQKPVSQADLARRIRLALDRS